MNKLLLLTTLLFLFSCENIEIPCNYDQSNSTWKMISRGEFQENEFGLEDGFVFELTHIVDDCYEVELGSSVIDTLQNEQDSQSPDWFVLKYGCKLNNLLYRVDENGMDLWFNSSYQNTLGTSNYQMINVDCL